MEQTSYKMFNSWKFGSKLRYVAPPQRDAIVFYYGQEFRTNYVLITLSFAMHGPCIHNVCAHKVFFWPKPRHIHILCVAWERQKDPRDGVCGAVHICLCVCAWCVSFIWDLSTPPQCSCSTLFLQRRKWHECTTTWPQTKYLRGQRALTCQMIDLCEVW